MALGPLDIDSPVQTASTPGTDDYLRAWSDWWLALAAQPEQQLALAQNPKAIATLADRGAHDFTKTFKRLTGPPSSPAGSRLRVTAAVRHWAAFVMSGVGQDGPPARKGR